MDRDTAKNIVGRVIDSSNKLYYGIGRKILSKPLSNLMGLGNLISAGNIQAIVDTFKLKDYLDKPIEEVIPVFVELLTENEKSLEAEVAYIAMIEVFNTLSYEENLSLEEYLKGMARNKYNGKDLCVKFLCKYIELSVIQKIDEHMSRSNKIKNYKDLNDKYEIIKSYCEYAIPEIFSDKFDDEKFSNIDWFGDSGRKVCDKLVTEIFNNLISVVDNYE